MAAQTHRKKEICMASNVTSLINKPPVLHSIAAARTASNPFLCSGKFFIKQNTGLNLSNKYKEVVCKLYVYTEVKVYVQSQDKNT